MEKLPKEFKAKWIAALRSGEYEQGSGQMKLNNKYCCLGVGCIVAGVPLNHINGNYPYNLFPEDKAKVPQNLRSDLNGDTPDMLGRMNDEGKSFLEIADWIEQNL